MPLPRHPNPFGRLLRRVLRTTPTPDPPRRHPGLEWVIPPDAVVRFDAEKWLVPGPEVCEYDVGGAVPRPEMK